MGCGNVEGNSINTIINILWPNIDKYFQRILTTDVQAVMEESLPAALSGLKFDKANCSLGPKPLSFKNINVGKTSWNTYRGPCEAVALQCEIDWDADTQIYLNFGPTSMGVENLNFKGCLLVHLLGLIPRPPFFRGVRIVFEETPTVEVTFGGVTSFLNLELVQAQIKQAVTACLGASIVVPNRIGFAITPDADIFNIKFPPADGLMKVTLIGATGLKAADYSLWSGSTSDPFAIIRCGTDVFQTPTRNGTVDPQWDHELMLIISDPVNQSVSVEVFDEDLMTGADPLGKCTLPAPMLLDMAGQGEKTVPLNGSEDGEPSSGSLLRLKVSWSPLILKSALKNCSEKQAGVVIFGVHSANCLPRGDADDVFWATASCSNVMLGFPQEPKSTPKVVEPVCTIEENTDDEGDEVDEVRSVKSVSNFGKKVALLQQHGINHEDMAKVLNVLPEELNTVLESVSSGNVRSLDRFAEHRIPTLTWEHGFEFPVVDAFNATVSVTLWRQGPLDESAHKIGMFRIATDELKNHKSCTVWKNVEISGAGVVVKVKFGLRFFECLAP